MKAPTAVAALAALAHESRLAVFRMLVEAGPEGLPAGVIATRLKVPPSSLTFHLQNLQRVARRAHRLKRAAPPCRETRNQPESPEDRMKRLHVHVSVDDLATSLRFYRELFAAEPVVLKSDYAKWMLEDPRVNFAISKRGGSAGLRHLGIQVEDSAELREVYARLQRADAPVREDGATTCCYAKSEKSWIADPQGIQWETFLTTGESTVYGVDEPEHSASACCEPSDTKPQSASRCCA